MEKELWFGRELKARLERIENGTSKEKLALDNGQKLEGSQSIDENCLYLLSKKGENFKEKGKDTGEYLSVKLSESALAMYKYQEGPRAEKERKELYYVLCVKCNLDKEIGMPAVKQIEQNIINGKIKVGEDLLPKEKRQEILKEFEKRYEEIRLDNTFRRENQTKRSGR